MDDLDPAATRDIRASLAPADADLVLREIRPAVALTRAHGLVTTRSHLGGRPMLEPDEAWPSHLGQPLSVLAVIHLSAFAPLLSGTGIDDSAVLSFFYDTDRQPWGYDPEHRSGWRVIRADFDTAQVREAPQGTTTFPDLPLDGHRVPTYPGWEEDVVEPITGGDSDDYLDLIERLEAGRRGPRHQLGGWPALQQGPWQLECQLASNGIYVGDTDGYRHPRVAELKPGADDWVMLAQIDSDEEAAWMWGDDGTLYFAMRRQDLAVRAYERAWMVLQCG